MSTSGFGHSGAYKAYRSFGPTAAAQSGLSLTSGLPGMPPAGWGFSYMDVMGGWMGGLALIMGLLQARKTGQGSYVDYAVTEGAMSLLGTYMLDFQVNGRTTRRPGFPPGNRSLLPGGGAPQHLSLLRQGSRRAGLVGVHRLRDADAVRVALSTHGPAGAVSGSTLRDQRGARGQPGRARRHRRPMGQAATALRRHAAGARRPGSSPSVVQSAEDRVEHDPQLKHRDMHPVIDHPEIGEFEYEGLSGQAVADAGLRARTRGRSCASTTATSTASCSA